MGRESNGIWPDLAKSDLSLGVKVTVVRYEDRVVAESGRTAVGACQRRRP